MAVTCPRCQGQIVERQGKYGTFFSCDQYPRCKFVMQPREYHAALRASEPVKVEKPFVPSKYQEAIFEWIVNGSGNAFVEAVAGSGKCLGRGTSVLLYDGTRKPVEEIQVGDLLMDTILSREPSCPLARVLVRYIVSIPSRVNRGFATTFM